MKNGTCFIVGAGEFCPRGLRPRKGDLVIAADGGLDHLSALPLRPHLLLGDMDSVLTALALPRIVFPREKNDTDVSLAVKVGMRMGYRRFALYAVGGGRPDHFLANIQLMAFFAGRGASLRAVLPEGDFWAVRNQALRIPTAAGKAVSVFCPDGRAEGVDAQGLYYPLRGAALTARFPLGVSNKATQAHIKISVRKGTLIVFVER